MKIRYIVFLTVVFSFPAWALGAADPLEASLEAVSRNQPILAAELRKLAGASDAVRRFLSDPKRVPIDPTEKFAPRWELGFRALEAEHWMLRRAQTEYPELVKSADILACVHAADQRHYAIFRIDSGLALGYYDDTAREFSTRIDKFDLGQSPLYFAFDVQSDLRGDTLLATWDVRVISGDTFRHRLTFHIDVHDHQLRLLKRVTEDFPIQKQ